MPPNEPSSDWSTLSNLVLSNLRNIPYLNLAMVQDELVPFTGPQIQNMGNPSMPQFTSFQDLGYRYRFQTYPSGEHFTLFLLDDYPFSAPFLAGTQVDRNPRHVTFSYMPLEDEPAFGLRHDHAYWVSGLELARLDEDSNGFPAIGTVDAFSHACGLGDPTTSPITSAGAVPLPYQETGQRWNPSPAIPAQNQLTVELRNVSAATLDVPRSGIDPATTVLLELTADSSGTLSLSGMASSASRVDIDYTAGTHSFRIRPDGTVESP